jgi:hypothetical protein
VLREEYLKTQQSHTFATITKAEVTSEHLVNVWEEISNVDSLEYRKMNAILNQKDFNRTTLMKTLHDCFLMDGSDRKLGKLGSTLMVDLLSMKRRAKHRIYCQKMESLSKAIWFTTILTKLKDHNKKSFQRIPTSVYKFLGVIHVLLMYGWPFTSDLFWLLMEKTIDPQDHKEIIVHRTIKAVREYLKISPDDFMKYLDSYGIQPCSELLAQIREMKQQKTRAVRAQQLKQRIGLYSPRLKATLTLNRNGGGVTRAGEGKPSGDGDGSQLDVNSLPPQQQQKYLSMIREQSESTNYGIEYNSLTPMRKAGGVGDGRKVAFAMSESFFDEEGEGEEDDQLSPLGSLMSIGSELPETVVEIGIPKRIK